MDCLERDQLSYPGAPEVREDGIDHDCDGEDRPCIQMFVAPYDAFSGPDRELYAVDVATVSAVSTGVRISENIDALTAFEP